MSPFLRILYFNDFYGLLYDPESQEETDGTVKYRVIKKSLIKQLIYKVVGEVREPSRRGVLPQLVQKTVNYVQELCGFPEAMKEVR